MAFDIEKEAEQFRKDHGLAAYVSLGDIEDFARRLRDATEQADAKAMCWRCRVHSFPILKQYSGGEGELDWHHGDYPCCADAIHERRRAREDQPDD